MADYRSVKVQMWRSDEWFQELPIDARLFWIYLFTNPSARVAGIYKLTVRTMSFETGIPVKRIEELKTQFSQVGKAHFEKDVVWVVKMRELQSPGKISENLLTGINNDVSEIPYCELKRRYMRRYGYPIDTLSEAPDTVCIPFPTTQHNTEETTTDQRDTKRSEGESMAAAPHTPLPPPARVFEDSGGSWPSGRLIDGTSKKERAVNFICEHVRDDPQSLELWGRVVMGYCAQWSPKSYTVMVNDYYCQGKFPGQAKDATRGNGSGPEKLSPGLEAVRIRQRQIAEKEAREHGNAN